MLSFQYLLSTLLIHAIAYNFGLTMANDNLLLALMAFMALFICFTYNGYFSGKRHAAEVYDQRLIWENIVKKHGTRPSLCDTAE
jgi:hypothetical protein